MKKHALIFAALLCAITVSAQDLGDDVTPRNRRGNEILPKQGDIGLGFNTIPILDMLLSTLNPSTTSSGAGNVVEYTQGSNNQIVGKYFLENKTAVRVKFGVNTLSGSITNQVQDAQAMFNASQGTADDIAAASLLRVDDRTTFRKSNWALSVGLEKRRGYRRLQGFYGAELGFGREAALQRTTYGNAFSDQYDVVFTNFTGSSISTNTLNPTAPGRTVRNLETRHTGGFRVGLRGFVGIEYFIFAKISIAAEYGWGYSIATRRAQTAKQEVYNNGQNGPAVFTEDVDIDRSTNTRGFSVDNNNGNIFSMNNTVLGSTALSGGAGALTLYFHF